MRLVDATREAGELKEKNAVQTWAIWCFAWTDSSCCVASGVRRCAHVAIPVFILDVPPARGAEGRGVWKEEAGEGGKSAAFWSDTLRILRRSLFLYGTSLRF